MKKYIVLCICLVAIVAVLSSCNYTQDSEGEVENMPVQEIGLEENGEISFQLLGSYEVDTRGIREWFGINESYPFTFFEQAQTFENYAQGALNEFNLDLSKIEFNDDEHQDRYIAISIGRELVEIRYERIFPSRRLVRSEITFAEEYNPNVLYIYVTDRISIGDPVLGKHTAFYIMHGSERIFEGTHIFDLNAQNEEYKNTIRERYYQERARREGSESTD